MTLAVFLTALSLGLRHGVDWDHIAAITDITSASPTRRRGFRLSMLYALGHALVVFLLGSIVILIGAQLPEQFDDVMGRIVGVTLLVLGLTVVVQLFRRGDDFRLRSRWMLVLDGTFAGLRRIRRLGSRRVIRVDHEHGHDHEDDQHEHQQAHDHAHLNERSVADITVSVGAPSPLRDSGSAHAHSHHHELMVPATAFAGYGPAGAAGIGMLHGIGVESPTQIALFVAASSSGGRTAGFVLLSVWVVGLVVANGAIAALTGWGVLHAERSRAIYLGIAVVVAAMSLVLGTMLVAGVDVLPEILAT